MKRFFGRIIDWQKMFWIGVWRTIKSMGTWRGALSLLIVWLTLSGAGLIALGFILAIPSLTVLGATIYGIWLLPLTPLMPITIGLAMLMQRYIFRDRSVGWSVIKEHFRRKT